MNLRKSCGHFTCLPLLLHVPDVGLESWVVLEALMLCYSAENKPQIHFHFTQFVYLIYKIRLNIRKKDKVSRDLDTLVQQTLFL